MQCGYLNKLDLFIVCTVHVVIMCFSESILLDYILWLCTRTSENKVYTE